MVEVWQTVTDWIRANHPSDVGAIISETGLPRFSAPIHRSMGLYTQRFVEFHTPWAADSQLGDPEGPYYWGPEHFVMQTWGARASV